MNANDTLKIAEEEPMLPEYDLTRMRVVKRGPGYEQKNAARLVRVTIDSDLAAIFGDDRAVNEALRTLLRMYLSVNADSQPPALA